MWLQSSLVEIDKSLHQNYAVNYNPVIQSQPDEQSQARRYQIDVLREMCLPKICQLLLTALQNTNDMKDECMNLADVIADEDYNIYKVSEPVCVCCQCRAKDCMVNRFSRKKMGGRYWAESKTLPLICCNIIIPIHRPLILLSCHVCNKACSLKMCHVELLFIV